MHKTSLNRTTINSVNCLAIEETTFEELRQGIVRILVEDKHYPKEVICPKLPRNFYIWRKFITARIDFVLLVAKNPCLTIIFAQELLRLYTRIKS